jgi:hypothetical protein
LGRLVSKNGPEVVLFSLRRGILGVLVAVGVLVCLRFLNADESPQIADLSRQQQENQEIGDGSHALEAAKLQSAPNQYEIVI